MLRNKKFLWPILALLILGAPAFYFIWRGFKGVPADTLSAQNPEEKKPSGLPPPGLDRPINITEDIPETVSKASLEKIAFLVAELKKNPDYFSAWLDLGSYRKLIGDWEGAIEAWEYAGAIRPLNYISFSNLGDLYHYYLKDFPKAEKNLLKALENEPTFISGYIALHELYSFSFKEKSHLADDILLQGISKNPENVVLLSRLASYYLSAGDRAKAREYYGKALGLEPGNEEFRRQFEALR
jgi:tetratricopeptide (TPR) repeat protein